MSNAEEIFRKSGAVLEGHFVLRSGRHSPVYWEKFRVLQFPNHVSTLCAMIAGHFHDYSVDLVAGPATGGMILAFEVGRQLGRRAIYAEKEGDKKTFRRGAVIAPGDRVLVVDDVITAGRSVNEVTDLVRERQGRVVGVGVLVDRTDSPPDFGAAFFSCLRTTAVTYAPDECPLCEAGVPLTKPGGV
ncbi:MAG: orotate phosphoribosyltransferase [Chloroflexi bacterium RBG_16_57_8]|nr:MAG: orotate phosphoribosyltransferase [Chloroflexi bacterium RBG_16_57_8]